MSLLNEQIDVQSTSSGEPALFAWRGHVFRVRRVIASWTTELSTYRLVRVATESDDGQASILDITQDPHSDSWTVRHLWA